MDWLYSVGSAPYQSTDMGPLPNESRSSLDPIFSTELFTNLKKNYDERIRNLETQIKATYEVIDNDEIVRTMKLSQVSEEFRKQRIGEIIEDSLSAEKEAEIDRLNKSNAYLKTEFAAIEQENQKIRNAYEEEAVKFQNTVAKITDALQVEVEARDSLENEKQQMIAALAQLSKQKEELVSEREQHLEGIRQKDLYIEEMKKDFEKISAEYAKIEGEHSKLKKEHDSVMKALNGTEDIHKITQIQIEELKNQLKQSENARESLQKEIDKIIKENEALASKSEYISTQVKQIVEEEQKVSVQMMEEMKIKFKIKAEEQMTQIMDLTVVNENLVKELASLKEELDESKLNCEKIIALMKNDMRVIKNEWEKRCQEVELSSERTIADIKAKHQIHITQLQAEYQTLLNKKMIELQNESEFMNFRPRPIDMEAHIQLENRINQIERDYILKTKHENILNTEILDLKTKHAKELKDLEEKYLADLGERVKIVAEKNRFEFESTIEILKTQNKSLEQQVNKFKSEIQRISEALNQEAEKSQKLAIQLDESDKNRKALKINLDEVNDAIKKTEEKYALELQSSKQKATQLAELTERNSQLQREIEKSSEELSKSNQRLETSENEKKALNKQVQELNEQLQSLSQALAAANKKLIDDVAETRRELMQKAEKELHELQSTISSLNTQVASLSEEITERDLRIEEQDDVITKLNSFLIESQQKSMSLETEFASSQKESKELRKQFEKLERKLQSLSLRGEPIILRKLSVMRESIENLRNQLETEVLKNKQASKSVITQIIQVFQERINTFHIVAQNEKAKEVARITQEYELKFKELALATMEEKIKEKSVLEQYQSENERLKRELEQSNQEKQTMWNTYQTASKKLEDENSKLRELSEQKTQELKNLQAFVNDEVKRLKEESLKNMNESISLVEKKYDEEIKLTAQAVNKLNETHALNLKKFEDMVGEVESVYSTYLAQTKESYEERLQTYERELAEVIGELEQRDGETTALKKEVEELQEKYQGQKVENARILEAFEEKIKVFRELVQKEEMEKNQRFVDGGSSSRSDYELLEENNVLKRELKIKEFKIEELQRAKDGMKQDVLRYKDLLDKKEKSFEAQHRELLKAGKQKEKEIKELQALLKKSIDSFNSTLDNNIKITDRLERDADEIAKTVRMTARSDHSKKVELSAYRR